MAASLLLATLMVQPHQVWQCRRDLQIQLDSTFEDIIFTWVYQTSLKGMSH
jgi:hypothetical protein